ncbi:tRNA (adenosine(37)-N6)-threonylcarbamoyltransferase complex ATPase subunit type 1 TsaE [Staphylococcus cohnii]|uniref:tRNA (adenosine(37)-N6)-threonylcarbamoyltransferase complex ATPase subunit type 1 TsaE n=1 Tax=Staphylococcus TaxID=1279 RepID=UPI0007D9B790|nr:MULTISPECIES: tRNA (adenosine(37)-N6)-threonylcarbamoyltransferase complex ATPase subunit type 1 TsaE [Staphylococcus]AQM41517.1 tRNA (adenosine(37)-N6)-threonylcarbamoyltransferase complex ATPase subunit type 1 TsaE [Staphylococcus cohnii]MBM9448173.1 tRNA (adenosine(37)-N6)-threonylcarbamoyltransferase complex ATPase subunit type 1 TsaE [Staphylococcus ureilyticus]MCQ9294645.1 tRNA (adenosine(37)-N6)-threonylcarbamoyltransferase complex ATPase subunit type 1 TsaE [Staphylococcus cohnii]OAO
MIKINDLESMEHFAKLLAKHLSAGDIILLNGDLGAGKTTLTQFIGKAMGVKRNINSPTFNIIKSYQGNAFKLHHMDCYRLEDSEEDLGFDEYFEDQAVTLIEWSEFIESFLPNNHLTINIKTINETTRNIEMKAVGQHYKTLKEAVEYDLSVD